MRLIDNLWTIYLTLVSLWLILAWAIWSQVGSDSGQAMPMSGMAFVVWVVVGSLGILIVGVVLAAFS